MREDFENCLSLCLKSGAITDKCAAAWRRAKVEHDKAQKTGDASEWAHARMLALEHHACTGDGTSDRIEYSFNRLSVMSPHQLDAIEKFTYDEGLKIRCKIERRKREWRLKEWQ